MKTKLFAVIVTAFVGYGVHAQGASATPPASGEIMKDRQQLKGDRAVRNQDQMKVRADREKLKEDIKSGASKDQIQTDQAALKQDRKARNEAQKKVVEDRHELRKDRLELRENRRERKVNLERKEK